ncbi:TIGR01777 family oxidoreductase [Blastococcus sp. Marseille-P5729]|uniref:TIGR01777 family oxidoreductase n=1 Tax=Blastococcus sp. Marseille-P5729 TaxID=2086582 RepID=UPI000D0F4881|nr:TIGR01777 family oxidoreductase [Blastococcus sp. Marseille-P5729]
MARFEYQTTLDHPREEVFEWHERPGALMRLNPPTLGKVDTEPTEGIRNGSQAVLRMSIPGTVGVAGIRWKARHLGYDRPHKFEDVMESGPMHSWHHKHLFSDTADGGTLVRDEIDFQLPFPAVGPAARIGERVARAELTKAWDYRARQLRFDLAFHAAHRTPKTVAISGATGLIGSQLAAFLGGGGHDVRRITRSKPSSDDIYWNLDDLEMDAERLRDIDVVVHLAGEPIAGRFTDEHKKRVLDSRRDSTRLLAATLAQLAEDGRPRALICASASGWYGPDRGDEWLTEDLPAGDGFLAEVCREWEAACQPARDAGVRVVNVRTGIVQSAAGGQLALQAPLFRIGAGGPLGDGGQWMPWIAIDDLLGIYAHAALTDGLAGPVNAAAPGIVRNEEYSKILAKVLRRPALLRVPRVGPAVLLGSEGADEFALAGQRMSSEKVRGWGYEFGYPDLEQALRHVLAR